MGSRTSLIGIGDPLPVAEGEVESFWSTFAALTFIVCLSGFHHLSPKLPPTIYPTCANLSFLNLEFANIISELFIPVITRCHKI